MDLGTGLVFSLISLRMIIQGCGNLLGKKTKESTGSKIRGSTCGKLTIGGIAGIPPGLLGIGTGAILVPAFALFLKAPIKIAIGSSLACFSVSAFFSSLLKFFQGFVYLPVALPICLGTLIGSTVDAVLNKQNVNSLKYGVKIWDGSEMTEELIKQSDVILAAGTVLVNGTFDPIMHGIHNFKKEYMIYGVTGAGICELMGLNRICPYSRTQ
ncbi:MAG: sulfite exporter TauE/SafE family protein [Syntrophaceae bacterium]|nr:sulfite exporter TauE/SafE family protein [Syntrophaceae bacterium]